MVPDLQPLYSGFHDLNGFTFIETKRQMFHADVLYHQIVSDCIDTIAWISLLSIESELLPNLQ